MTEFLLLLLAGLLTLACAVFVAAEFSLTTVERGDLERAAHARERGAEGALKAVRRLTLQLSGAQLGITVTSLVIGMLAEPSLAELLRGPLNAVGLPEGVASTVAVVLGVAVSTVLLMVVGELVPKNWAIARPLAVAKVVAAPQRGFTTAFGPFIRHLNESANRLVRRFGLEPAEELITTRSAEELMALARHSAAQGTLQADSAELFVRTLHLGELTAENVMTPRVAIQALEASASAADAANLTLATGLSRFPVYRDSLDEIVGTVHIRDVLALDAGLRARTPVTELTTPPLRVPDSLPVDRMLDRLRLSRTMAVVIDEYGGTAGVVTLEDIVEEIVGEVRDEHDPAEKPGLARVGEEVWEVDGGVRLDELTATGLQAPQGPYETVAGLIAALLGRIPDEGDTVEVRGGRLTVLTVLSMDRHRAGRVLIAGAADTGGTADAADAADTADSANAADAADRADAADPTVSADPADPAGSAEDIR